MIYYRAFRAFRGVAQPGSALRSGRRGRRFKSFPRHHINTVISVLKRWRYNQLQLNNNPYPTLYSTRKAHFYH